MSRTAYDPSGATYGIPTYPFRMAPAGLATRRQLAELKLRPANRQEPDAQIVWRAGARFAYLYQVARAVPKRPATPAQLKAVAAAMIPRRTCGDCGQVKAYCVSTRTGLCAACTGRWS